MSKIITFSRQFPSYHPRAGEPTYFVEQIWNGFRDDYFTLPDTYVPFVREYVRLKQVGEAFHFGGVKHHTIRAGHRFKAGDWFSPRVWSGKPYHSKMIEFAPDIQVKKVWNFKIVQSGEDGDIVTNGFINGKLCRDYKSLATSDGLTHRDFADWFLLSPDFKKTNMFDGQIIAWNESIEY